MFETKHGGQRRPESFTAWQPTVDPLSPTEEILYKELIKPPAQRDQKLVLECDKTLAIERQTVVQRYAHELAGANNDVVRGWIELELALNTPGSEARKQHFGVVKPAAGSREEEVSDRLHKRQAKFGGRTGTEQFNLLMQRAGDRDLAKRNLSPAELAHRERCEQDMAARMGLPAAEPLRKRLTKLGK
jgi:hypothetical protein